MYPALGGISFDGGGLAPVCRDEAGLLKYTCNGVCALRNN